MKNKELKNLAFALVSSLIVTILCGIGTFSRPDMWVQDALFQRPKAVTSDIVIIGITEEDFKTLGPYKNWDRNIMASVLEELGKDPDNRPAVVAIDTLYAGNTTEEEDERLAAAAASLGNVITATTAYFGTTTSFDGQSVVVDDYSILNYEEPYDQLKAVTTQGHINAMLDKDGIMRHALLYVEPDGQKVYSMAYETAKCYAAQNNISIKEPPINSRGHFDIVYTYEPGDFYEGVSIKDILSGEIPSSYYANKIVLIGPYAAALQDSYFAPIDQSVQMYGVEIQANVVQYILDGKYVQDANDFVQLLVLGLVCFAFMYLCQNKKLRISVPILILFVLLGIGGSLLLHSAGYTTHASWIPIGVFLLFVVSIAKIYIRAAIEKQNVTRTFERYVAPNIVDEILKEGTDSLKLGGKHCDIAVLFVDIRGFTTMSERLSPEEVVFILNQYLTMTSSCIENNYGTLDKFVGDATMAFWGAPLPQEDPIYLAAKTALDIVAGAKELSAKLKEEINEELNVGVGVHYGPAVVGNMGSVKHMDYTAIGDTVNTAARLEANAPGGTVYISRTVADALEGRMSYTSLGSTVKLKGKAEGFEVLRLIGPEE